MTRKPGMFRSYGGRFLVVLIGAIGFWAALAMLLVRQ